MALIGGIGVHAKIVAVEGSESINSVVDFIRQYIVITASELEVIQVLKDEPGMEAAVLAAGVSDYIRKPVYGESLKRRVEAQLELVRTLRVCNEWQYGWNTMFDTIFDQSPVGITILQNDEKVLVPILVLEGSGASVGVLELDGSEAQMQYLSIHGCDRVQGYFISRPLDESVALDLIKRGDVCLV